MSDNNNNEALKDLSVKGTTPGELLAAERERQSMDEKTAADALKISVHRLKSIESDRYDDFPSETYVRGHLRNYCRLLNVDELAIMALYEDSKPQPVIDANEQDTASEAAIAQSHKQWWAVYVILVLLVLLWVASYWFVSGSSIEEASIDASVLEPSSKIATSENVSKQLNEQSAEDIVDEKSEVSEVEASEGVTADNALPIEGNIEDAEKEILVSKMTAAELVKTVMAEQQPPSPEIAQESVAVVGDTLSFDFENPCWVKVTDANGDVIFAGLQQPGTELSLSGKSPFRIIVGNVEGTSLVYNGEPVVLTAPADRKAVSLQVGG